MMKKKQSRGWRIMWIAVTLPLIGVSLMAFSKPKEALKVAVDNSVKAVEQPLAEVVKAVSVENTAVAAEPQKPEKAEEPRQKASEVKAGDKITGEVKAQDNGEPLEGVSVVEIDEYGRIVAASLTDKNGKYTFKVVNPKHKVRVSYVGRKSQTLDISSQMSVVLEPMTQFSSITVVGRRDSIDLNSPRYKDQTKDNKDDNTFNLVEQMPTFPGGQGEIMRYLSTNLRYPAVAREMRVEGEVVVRFTVDKTGLVRSPQVVEVNAKSPLITAELAKAAKEGDEEAEETSKNYFDAIEAMKEEAIHVVRNMSRWEPGRQNGKRISTPYTLPIVFKLQ